MLRGIRPENGFELVSYALEAIPTYSYMVVVGAATDILYLHAVKSEVVKHLQSQDDWASDLRFCFVLCHLKRC